jgi:hypothetical protein
MLDGNWYALMSALRCHGPASPELFSFSVLKATAHRSAGERQALHSGGFQLGKVFTAMDRPILHNIHYSPGILTRQDGLARYLNRAQVPRSHARRPSWPAIGLDPNTSMNRPKWPTRSFCYRSSGSPVSEGRYREW